MAQLAPRRGRTGYKYDVAYREPPTATVSMAMRWATGIATSGLCNNNSVRIALWKTFKTVSLILVTPGLMRYTNKSRPILRLRHQ